jgi:hypothetical protein
MDPIDFSTWTPEQALASLNAAIYSVETKGQRYTIGDRELWRGDLRWMYPERARLEKIVNARARKGPRFHRVVPL